MNKRKNNDFFSSLNPLPAYYAGFIAADGNIAKTNRITPSLSIHISNTDLQWLQTFKKKIKTDCIITKCKDGSINIRISSHKIEYDLRTKYNITERKSLTLKHPNITDNNLVVPFIAGVIDGDGCVSIQYPNMPKIIILGTESLMVWIKNWVDNNLGDRRNPNMNVACVRKRGNIFEYKITGVRAFRLWLLIKRYNLPVLKRKWDKIQKVLSSNSRLLLKAKENKCSRCGLLSYDTVPIPSLGKQYLPICGLCDVALNELVQRFMGIDHWAESIQQYAKSKDVDYIADYAIENISIEKWTRPVTESDITIKNGNPTTA